MTVRTEYALQRSRCLRLLERRGPQGATTAELSHPAIGGHEGPRRVRELREQGYPVQRERISGSGYWRYWLGAPPPSTPLLWDAWEDRDE